MKKSIRVMTLTAGLVILFAAPGIAWSDDDDHHPRSVFQTSEVYSIADGMPIAGGGTLNRNKRSVHLRVSAAGLDMNSTYSAWFIVFNHPEACGGDSAPQPCSEADFGVEAVHAALLNAGGFVTGADGTGYFVGELNKKDHPEGLCCFGELRDGMRPEIHVVIETHDTHDIGEVSTQMSEPMVACNPMCDDQFFLVFPPAR